MTKLEQLINELCPDSVEYKRIDELCIITRGRVMSKDYIRDNVGQYPVYSSQTENNGELGKISTYDFEGEYLTWTTDGANAGSVFYRNGKFSVTNVCGLLKVKVDEITTKYLYHILSITAPKYVNKGMGNPKLMSNVMARIKVPLPPLSIQSEIVHILDSFTLLTAELTAELTARQKQYAFYRDYLLDFSDEDVTKKIPDIDCSNVEYKRLGDIATAIYRGAGIKRDEVTETGIPCVRYGEIYTTYNVTFNDCVSHTDEDKIQNKKYFEYGDVLFAITGESVEEIAKSCVYLGHDICLAGGDIVVLKHNQNPKYMAYVLSTTNAQSQKSKGKVKSKVVHSSVPAISDIIIPIPPLAEQKKIANMIERFDHLCNDISNGLPAEIEARKKQYEYYRDTLLSFDDKACSHIVKVERERELSRIKAIKWLSIQELFNLKNGYTPSKSKSEYWTNGTLPWFRMEDIRENGHILNDSIQHITPEAVKGKLFPANSIILATSATIGEHALITVDSLANQRFTYLTPKEEYSNLLNMKYVFYYFFKIDEWYKNNLNISSFASVDMNKFKKLKFPVPPLEEQERIVSILDRFDKLCNDISEGLPAEIEARQKQYEYYRDKLLTFKE